MKIKNYITICLFFILILVLGFCGKKEEPQKKEEELQLQYEAICEKMMNCMLETLKAQNFPGSEQQIQKFKQQCKENMVKYSKSETQKEYKEYKDDAKSSEKKVSYEEIKACLNAIKDASCEKIMNNQVVECSKLMQN